MTNHHDYPYCQADDFRLSAELIGLAPIEGRAFMNFKETAERANGVISGKFRELIDRRRAHGDVPKSVEI